MTGAGRRVRQWAEALANLPYLTGTAVQAVRRRPRRRRVNRWARNRRQA